jgi:2-polyprenyl-6-hydroxyphenyl methylase/3-demethylubiquinone-9 3-methyltransferase
MDNKIVKYLSSFGNISALPRKQLLDEIDRVWIQYGLNNRRNLASQAKAVAEFYNHPVWVLNGLFSDYDSVSKKHRVAIAEQVKKLNASRVADFGGGSGVLARCITEVAEATIDIIEPYPSNIFVERFKKINSIRFVDKLKEEYDVVIAQDLLEHVDNPTDLALQLICATRMNGHLIFANSFYPIIKCHLPSTFYLRYTFIKIMSYAGLTPVGPIVGAEHAIVFRRVSPIQKDTFKYAVRMAKILGPIMNMMWPVASKCKQIINMTR